MNKRQAKKRFKKIFGEKIWRMRMQEPRKTESASHKKRRDKNC